MLATANTGEIRRGLGKNAGEWTGRIEMSKKEIPGSKRSMHGMKAQKKEMFPKYSGHRLVRMRRRPKQWFVLTDIRIEQKPVCTKLSKFDLS